MDYNEIGGQERRDYLKRKSPFYWERFIGKTILIVAGLMILFFIWVNYAQAVDWKGEALKAHGDQIIDFWNLNN